MERYNRAMSFSPFGTAQLLLLLAAASYAQTPAQLALDQEPEVKQIAALERNFSTIAPRYSEAERQALAQRKAQGEQPSIAASAGAGVGAAAGAGLEMLNSMKAISILWNRLDARLRDQLIECQAKCPAMAAMEQEYAEMKKRELAHQQEMDSLDSVFGLARPSTDSPPETTSEREQMAGHRGILTPNCYPIRRWKTDAAPRRDCRSGVARKTRHRIRQSISRPTRSPSIRRVSKNRRPLILASLSLLERTSMP